jgi:hypothetical protein
MRSPVDSSDLTKHDLFDINLTELYYPIKCHAHGSFHIVTNCMNFCFNLRVDLIYDVH